MSYLLECLRTATPLQPTRVAAANGITAAFVRADAGGDDTEPMQERRDAVQEALYALQNAMTELEKYRPSAVVVDGYMADAMSCLQVRA
jgi:hypothetical protein